VLPLGEDLQSCETIGVKRCPEIGAEINIFFDEVKGNVVRVRADEDMT
jgi:hypothetical protein